MSHCLVVPQVPLSGFPHRSSVADDGPSPMANNWTWSMIPVWYALSFALCVLWAFSGALEVLAASFQRLSDRRRRLCPLVTGM